MNRQYVMFFYTTVSVDDNVSAHVADSDVSLFVLSWSNVNLRNHVLNALCYSESTFFID